MESNDIMKIMILGAAFIITVGALSIAFYNKKKMDKEESLSS